MKRPLIAVFILLLSLGIGVFSFLFVKTQCEEIKEKLELSVIHLEKRSVKKAREEVMNARNIFESKEKYLNVFVGQELSSTLNDNIEKASFYLKLNKQDLGLIYIKNALSAIDNAVDSNRLKIDRIF